MCSSAVRRWGRRTDKSETSCPARESHESKYGRTYDCRARCTLGKRNRLNRFDKRALKRIASRNDYRTRIVTCARCGRETGVNAFMLNYCYECWPIIKQVNERIAALKRRRQ